MCLMEAKRATAGKKNNKKLFLLNMALRGPRGPFLHLTACSLFSSCKDLWEKLHLQHLRTELLQFGGRSFGTCLVAARFLRVGALSDAHGFRRGQFVPRF